MGRDAEKKACSACRAAKRKCDGRTPCGRCKRYGKAGECEPAVAKKRGRPRKDPTAEKAAGPKKERKRKMPAALPAAMPSPQLLPRQAFLSALLSHGHDMVVHRPREVALCLDIHLGENFIVTRMPPMELPFTTLLAPYKPLLKKQCMSIIGPPFAAALVVAGEMRSTPLNLLGKTLGEIMETDSEAYEDEGIQDQPILDFICAAPGTCSINRRVFPAQKLNKAAVVEGVSDRSGYESRVAILFDERGVARYMFSAILNPTNALLEPSEVDDLWDGSLDDNMFSNFFNGMEL